MAQYIPKPVDTSGVILSEEIMQVAEMLSQNTHEVWSTGKLAEGWTYGEVLDAQNKKHPCLVPYEQLTEAEKDYDRNTSLETIKALYAMGFEIKRREL